MVLQILNTTLYWLTLHDWSATFHDDPSGFLADFFWHG